MLEQKQELNCCPYCGGTETIETYQGGYAVIAAVDYKLGPSVSLHHIVCRDCGNVIRSFVNDPEKLLKKKHRRDN